MIDRNDVGRGGHASRPGSQRGCSLRRLDDVELDAVLSAEPLQAREALRRMLEGGRIVLTPGDDGVYIAEGTFLPLVALAETTKPPAGSRGPGHGTAISCAGALRGLDHAISLAFEIALTAARPEARVAATPNGVEPGGRSIPAASYVLAGVGVVGIAAFSYLFATALSRAHELRDTCSPSCAASDLDAVRTKNAVGNVSLGVGIAALAGAVAWYFLHPTAPPRSADRSAGISF